MTMVTDRDRRGHNRDDQFQQFPSMSVFCCSIDNTKNNVCTRFIDYTASFRRQTRLPCQRYNNTFPRRTRGEFEPNSASKHCIVTSMAVSVFLERRSALIGHISTFSKHTRERKQYVWANPSNMLGWVIMHIGRPLDRYYYSNGSLGTERLYVPLYARHSAAAATAAASKCFQEVQQGCIQLCPCTLSDVTTVSAGGYRLV